MIFIKLNYLEPHNRNMIVFIPLTTSKYNSTNKCLQISINEILKTYNYAYKSMVSR